MILKKKIERISYVVENILVQMIRFFSGTQKLLQVAPVAFFCKIIPFHFRMRKLDLAALPKALPP